MFNFDCLNVIGIFRFILSFSIVQAVVTQKLSSRFSSTCEKSQKLLKRYKYTERDSEVSLKWSGNSITNKILNVNEQTKLPCGDAKYEKNGKWVKGPPLIIQWYKDGVSINKTNPRYKIEGCSKKPPYLGSHLKIKDLKLSDSGVYECVVSRMDLKVVSLSKEFQLFVCNEKNHSPPIPVPDKRILETVKEKDLPANNLDGNLLYCLYNVNGDSNVKISWYLGGAKRSEATKIIEVCYPGTYSCQVNNELGGFNKTFIISHKDLHCRSSKIVFLLLAGIILGLLTFCFIIGLSIMKKVFVFKKSKSKHSLKKVSEAQSIYGMFVYDKEPMSDNESWYARDEIPITKTTDQDFCLLSTFKNQIEENVSVDDLKLVKSKEISRERLTCVNDGGKPLELGSGFFGSVFRGYLATDNGGKISVAIKVLKSTSIGIDYGLFIEEAATLIRSEGHENVISLLGTCIADSLADENKLGATPKVPILIMELADGGNLHTYLKQCRENCSRPCVSGEETYQQTVDFNELVSICHQVALGMKHLGEKKILHRDLAARNILLTKNKVVKIGDFGLSKHLFVKNYYRICSRLDIPVKWTSPEALSLNCYTVWSDVWSFGVLMWEVFSLGADPYPTIKPRDLYQMLKRGVRLPHPETATDQLYQCMLSCWVWKPERRPTFDQLEKELQLIGENPEEKLSEQSGMFSDYYSRQAQHASEHIDAKPPSIKLVNENSSTASSRSWCSTGSPSEEVTCSSEIAATCKGSIAAKLTPEVQFKLNPQTNDSALPKPVDSCAAKSDALVKSDANTNASHTTEDKDLYVTHKVACNLNLKSQSRPTGSYNATKVLSGVRNCLMFENQSYQSRKTQLSSLESPTECGSDSSNPTDNEVEKKTFETYRYFDVFGSSLFEETA